MLYNGIDHQGLGSTVVTLRGCAPTTAVSTRPISLVMLLSPAGSHLHNERLGRHLGDRSMSNKAVVVVLRHSVTIGLGGADHKEVASQGLAALPDIGGVTRHLCSTMPPQLTFLLAWTGKYGRPRIEAYAAIQLRGFPTKHNALAHPRVDVPVAQLSAEMGQVHVDFRP